MNLEEREIATKKTVMWRYHGKLRPIKISIKDHNMNAPKKTEVKKPEVNEDSASRAARSNEYQFHSAPSTMLASAPKKIRVKNIKTGATVGIHNTHADAMKQFNSHPMKHLLKVEDAELNAMAFLSALVEMRDQIEEGKNAQPTMTFSAYRALFEDIGKTIDEAINEKRQLLLDKKKKSGTGDIELEMDESKNGVESLRKEHRKVTELLNKAPTEASRRIHRMKLARLRQHARKHYSIDLNESVFDWKKGKSEIDWKDTKDKHDNQLDGDEVTKPKKDVNAPKKSVGRPAGEYGKYKTAGRTEAEKKAIADKVHNNPERKAAYADAIASRREFTSMMNNSIKKRQAELSGAK